MRAAQDFARRNARWLVKGSYPPGMLVLIYQVKFEVNQKFAGNKYRNRWAGPFKVRKCLPSGAYLLSELNGADMRGTVAGNRVKLFYAQDGTPEMDSPADSEDDSGDSDELGLNGAIVNDEDYLPSNATAYMRYPNRLSSYKAPSPNWFEVWERWQQRKRAQMVEERENIRRTS